MTLSCDNNLDSYRAQAAYAYAYAYAYEVNTGDPWV